MQSGDADEQMTAWSSSARYGGAVWCRHLNNQLKLDALWHLQPVQLCQEWHDVVVPVCCIFMYLICSKKHHNYTDNM